MHRGVKTRVVFFMVLFTLLLTLVVSTYSFLMMHAFERNIRRQSAELNLRLAATLIKEDIEAFENLARECAVCPEILSWFAAKEDSVPLSLSAYDALLTVFRASPASRFAGRVLVFDTRSGRLVQTGISLSASEPVTSYNTAKIGLSGLRKTAGWHAPVPSPYFYGRTDCVLPYTRAIIDPATGIPAGLVYIEAQASVVTDKLAALLFDSSGLPLISEGGQTWRVYGDRLYPSGEEKSFSRYELVTSPVLAGNSVSGGFSLVYAINRTAFFRLESANTLVIMFLCVVTLLAAFLVMNREIDSLVRKRLASERHKRDLEYRMLQNQINPHFLQNTLNSIKWLASSITGAGAAPALDIAAMTVSLSRLLSAVTRDLRKISTIKEELVLLDNYILIQQYRYGGSITFTKVIDEESLLDGPIPRFSLQPIVENAIFHGIEPKGEGTITLRLSRSGEDTLVTVTDDGAGMDAETLSTLLQVPCTRSPFKSSRESEKGGIGVRNVAERLRYAFGEAYGLAVSSEKGRFTTVTMRLPSSLQRVPQPLL